MTPAEIREIRKREGWTQQKLADEIGVTVRTVKHWEAGTRSISLPAEKLLKLIIGAKHGRTS